MQAYRNDIFSTLIVLSMGLVTLWSSDTINYRWLWGNINGEKAGKKFSELCIMGETLFLDVTGQNDSDLSRFLKINIEK